jgi:two-component system sensor histidine kinase/response regulator
VRAKAQIMTVLSIYNTKVLIADDNKILVEIIQEELESFSFEISSVNSGKAALAELETVAPEKSYDLVLLDWKMPGMDGLETANRIKKNPRLLKKPKIIMMTAFSREDIFKIGDKSNLDAFLTKPIIQSLLFDTIMNVFGKQVAKTSRLLQKQASINAESNLLQGMRVLIVEDNIINQQVVREPLVNEDFIFYIANIG